MRADDGGAARLCACRLIKRMHQRLSFLRTPRHAAQQPMPAAPLPVAGGSPPSPRTCQQPGLPLECSVNGSSPAGARSSTTTTTTSSSSVQLGLAQGVAACMQSPRGAGFAVVPPHGVHFGVYEPGGVYHATVQLQNVGAVAQQLRLLPPASRYFQVSLPR